MKLSYSKLPKSLKKVFNNTNKTQGIKIKDYLRQVEKDGQQVFHIDYKFEHNYFQYQSFFDGDLKKIISEKTTEFEKLIHTIGSHLFGDNVENFYNSHTNDDGLGKWEIIIENPSIEDWLSVDVYLVPSGF